MIMAPSLLNLKRGEYVLVKGDKCLAACSKDAVDGTPLSQLIDRLIVQMSNRGNHSFFISSSVSEP